MKQRVVQGLATPQEEIAVNAEFSRADTDWLIAKMYRDLAELRLRLACGITGDETQIHAPTVPGQPQR